MTSRKLLALLLPEGLVLLAAAALVHWAADNPAAAPVVRLFPLAVLATGAFLGWRFGRGRLLLALLGLLIADGAMRWLVPLDSDAPYAGPAIVRATAMLLPASLAVLAFLTERGPLTTAGLRRLAVLGAESVALLAVLFASAVYPRQSAAALDATLLPHWTLDWMHLGQPASVVALTAIAVLIARVLWRPDPVSRGFLWAAIGSTIAAAAGPAHGRATLYLACAGLVLVVATIESAYAMAYQDELTGLPARRALNEALQASDGTYTVAMVDVDHFKKFNDTHGHDVGDQVLRMVAERLGRVEGGGRAFRYGGEEFAVLFRGRSCSESLPHLERLRTSVADASFTVRGKDRPKHKPETPRRGAAGAKALTVTVSIGAAQARGAALPDEVVKWADRALYRAKEGGRNRLAV